MSSEAASADVVETLMDVREGDCVRLEAERYGWASPFEVAEIDEQSWATPTGKVWRSRRIELDPTSNHPTAKARQIDVYQDGPSPDAGPGYGRYVRCELKVDEEGVEAEDVTVDGVDESDEHDEIEIDLPEGVTPADIDEITLEVDTLGEVAERLGVPVDRARTITFHLGVYSRVRETWRNLERGER